MNNLIGYMEMNEQKIDELIDKALREEAQLPEGLGARLERHIDGLAASDRAEARRIPMRRRWLARFSVAASILLAIGTGIYFSGKENAPKDTFSDPQEAALVASQALAFMSENLNKGLDNMQQAQKKVAEVNNVLDKQFK